MHNLNRFIVLAILLPFALLSFSCTQDMEGIFYSLEKEIKVPDNSLNNDISVTGVIKVGSYYLAAAGSVFYRGLAATEWQKLKSPIADGVVTDIETDGINVVVGVTNGGTHGLYKLDMSGAPAYPAAPPFYSAKQVFKLFRVDNRILASVGVNEAEAELRVINAGVTATTAAGFSSPGAWVRGAAFNGTNTYYVCTSTDVYSWTGSIDTPTWSAVASPGVSPLRDVYHDGTNLYLSAKNWLKMGNGAAWTVSANNTSYDFTTWTKVNGKLLVGTDGSGYREVDSASLAISTPPGNFLRIPNLLYATVLAAFTDGNTVFFGTSVNGLWRGDYTTTTDPSWSQE